MIRYAFPAALITLNVGAALVSMYAHDWRRAVYWTAAAILVACVTL